MASGLPPGAGTRRRESAESPPACRGRGQAARRARRRQPASGAPSEPAAASSRVHHPDAGASHSCESGAAKPKRRPRAQAGGPRLGPAGPSETPPGSLPGPRRRRSRAAPRRVFRFTPALRQRRSKLSNLQWQLLPVRSQGRHNGFHQPRFQIVIIPTRKRAAALPPSRWNHRTRVTTLWTQGMSQKAICVLGRKLRHRLRLASPLLATSLEQLTADQVRRSFSPLCSATPPSPSNAHGHALSLY